MSIFMISGMKMKECLGICKNGKLRIFNSVDFYLMENEILFWLLGG